MLRALILLIVLLIPSIGEAQTKIAGVSVNCVDALGVPVVTIPFPQLGDVGMARIEPNGARVIYLNPIILYPLPRFFQLFWYTHECAHHYLGHTYGFHQLSREIQADCWAVRLGRDQRWLSREDIKKLIHYFEASPGSPWGHLPGQQRVQLLLECYDS